MFFEDDVLSKKHLRYATSAQGSDKKMLFVASHHTLTAQAPNHKLSRQDCN